MKTPSILILLFTLPIFCPEEKDNCHRMSEDKNKANPEKLVYTGTDGIIEAIMPDFRSSH